MPNFKSQKHPKIRRFFQNNLLCIKSIKCDYDFANFDFDVVNGVDFGLRHT